MLWQSKYETGNTQVDNEHKEIFMLVQNVIEANFDYDENKIEETIDFLAKYTLNHFQNEENLMEESGYPDRHIHINQHVNFVSQVLALRERVTNESDRTINNTDIKNVIVNWLTDHVLGSDRIMADYYRKWASK